MKGVKKFSEAADAFFEKVSEQLKEKIELSEIQGVNHATAIAELIYKVNQSIKLMRDDGKKKKNDNDDETEPSKNLAQRMSRVQ